MNFGPGSQTEWDWWLLVGQKDDFDATSSLDHLGSSENLGVNPKNEIFLREFKPAK